MMPPSRIQARFLVLLAGFLLIFTAGFAQETIPFFKPGMVRVLIFSGRNNHDWRTTSPFLKQVLLDSGRFDVRVEEEPVGVTSETLAAYDAIVLDYNGPRWGDVTEKAVAGFVRSGKGLVAVHGASYAFTGIELLGDGHKKMGIKQPPWPEYLQMIGGYWSEETPKSGHGQRHTFPVKLVNREHPITKGMPESFLATDELYHNLRLTAQVNVLATAFDDLKMGGTGKDEPILWTVAYGKGRVFHTTLGHDLAAMQEAGFVSTFVRGTEWAATGAVTLPPAAAALKTNLPPLRLMVVTGGHDYPTTFYTLFEGVEDFRWDHAASNHEAFRNDLRPKYDVLVLYDFSKVITEAEKTNLRSFVEDGKGLVVLHHAIVDYPDWEWWYKDVVGGKYFDKAEGNTPASTYKHGEELIVQPVISHPITARVGPLHLWDETYKGMWISPTVTVLLRTDNPASDGPVAWVSPYAKSRVVYIQLGHDEKAHLHAGYQNLVRDAIRWSAERIGDSPK